MFNIIVNSLIVIITYVVNAIHYNENIEEECIPYDF